ncbi:hypothetical protein EDC39_11232 [Geothermobacter ehrlichii]|uniref:Uncharacterized protein n=1 Tax=Geothermobacter ehrlichii TaxID=213224 RepID=A0A5D3WJH9_9BACT|nr:hypothetical protein EDC39_11232 [Geothermobacter ehrlichii]
MENFIFALLNVNHRNIVTGVAFGSLVVAALAFTR